MPQRPTSVTVFGILNIVFGALGLLCTPISLAAMFLLPTQGNPVLEAMRENRLYLAWTIVSGSLSFVVSGILLAAGVGLLNLKPWARVTSIICAIYGIAACVLGQAMNLSVMIPYARKLSESGGPQAAAGIGGMIGGVFGSCFGLIYPILLLIFLTRPTVKAAFQPTIPPAGCARGKPVA